MHSLMRRIFRFDENSLNTDSSSSNSLRLFPIRVFSRPRLKVKVIGVFNHQVHNLVLQVRGMILFLLTHTLIITGNHPPTTSSDDLSSPPASHVFRIILVPSSERVVELQSDIREKLGELMPNKSSQDVLCAAEAVLHKRRKRLYSLSARPGVESEAYKDALNLAGGR